MTPTIEETRFNHVTTKRKHRPKRQPTNAKKTPAAAAEEKFVRDLLIRGEAARPDSEGNLPTNTTHEIVEEKEGELPTVERHSFKIY